MHIIKEERQKEILLPLRLKQEQEETLLMNVTVLSLSTSLLRRVLIGRHFRSVGHSVCYIKTYL